MITYKIYGTHKRDEMIQNLKTKLSLTDDNVFYDDRPNGGDPLYTAKKAYLSDHGDATHAIVLQDDVEVCNNFKEICNQIISTHPDKIISLFPYQHQKKNEIFDNLYTPYVEANILSGCGVIMPVEYIKPCFDWIYETFNDNVEDDYGIQSWARHNEIEIITTIPSLIQHIGDESLLNKYRGICRTEYYDENPKADWTKKDIFKIPKKYGIDFTPIRKNILNKRGGK